MPFPILLRLRGGGCEVGGSAQLLSYQVCLVGVEGEWGGRRRMCPQPGKHEVLGTLALARSWAGPATVSMWAAWCPASAVDIVRRWL